MATIYYVSVNGGSGSQIYNVDASYFTNQNRGFEVDLNNTAASVVIDVINAGSSLNFQKGPAVKVNGSPIFTMPARAIHLLLRCTSQRLNDRAGTFDLAIFRCRGHAADGLRPNPIPQSLAFLLPVFSKPLGLQIAT